MSRAPKLAAWVNPNAKCPVCGQSVYYYQNSAGSRVFFDELGPPWPKHPCTDNKHDAQPYELTSRSPVVRPLAEVRSYKEAARTAGIGLPASPPVIALIVLKARQYELTVAPAASPEAFIECYRITSADSGVRPRRGDLVFRSGKTISFFHRATMRVVTFVVERLPDVDRLDPKVASRR